MPNMYNNYQGWQGQVQMPNPANMYQRNQPLHMMIRVHGKEGVDAFQMGPDSDALLLDDTGPYIWAKVTDGAGYSDPVRYRLVPDPIKELTPGDYVTREEFMRLDEKRDKLIGAFDGKPDFRHDEPAKEPASEPGRARSRGNGSGSSK